jgi:hypothetical protein
MIATSVSELLRPTGRIETDVLANACMTGDVFRDYQLAKNILMALQVANKTQPGIDATFLRDLQAVGFYAAYGEFMLGLRDSPKYADPSKAIGVEIVSR